MQKPVAAIIKQYGFIARFLFYFGESTGPSLFGQNKKEKPKKRIEWPFFLSQKRKEEEEKRFKMLLSLTAPPAIHIRLLLFSQQKKIPFISKTEYSLFFLSDRDSPQPRQGQGPPPSLHQRPGPLHILRAENPIQVFPTLFKINFII